ncbi:hypothetical protein MUP79_01755, partial [Candidatus Bathyarchaeota archaeon]|nr:hypothetical protein [Candidatus Bathyarchaeota archaeon]
RLLDDKIRSRLSNAIDNEIMLRILTLNLMILLLIALQRVLNKATRPPFPTWKKHPVPKEFVVFLVIRTHQTAPTNEQDCHNVVIVEMPIGQILFGLPLSLVYFFCGLRMGFPSIEQ